jgi:hypothetical protein
VLHRNQQNRSLVRIGCCLNRVDMLRADFSLANMASLSAPLSRLRNPAIAAVVPEINRAESKDRALAPWAPDALGFISMPVCYPMPFAPIPHRAATAGRWAWR